MVHTHPRVLEKASREAGLPPSIEVGPGIPVSCAALVTQAEWDERVAWYRNFLRDPSWAESWAETHILGDELEREMREGPRPQALARDARPTLSARAQRREENKREWAGRYARLPGRRILR
jgi:hypothetical protein